MEKFLIAIFENGEYKTNEVVGLRIKISNVECFVFQDISGQTNISHLETGFKIAVSFNFWDCIEIAYDKLGREVADSVIENARKKLRHVGLNLPLNKQTI